LALHEASPLSLCDCWERASEEERRWFVNNVGLQRLLQFAPRDQCTALLRQLTDASGTQSLRHWFHQSLRVIRERFRLFLKPRIGGEAMTGRTITHV
jgi:hypothetical protein